LFCSFGLFILLSIIKTTTTSAGVFMGTQEAINNIIRLVGGQGNINKVWHCMTRLRFDLVDRGRHCAAFSRVL
jgi:hypothetical protein